VIANLNLTKNDINRVIEKEKLELQRREKKYREGRAFADIAGKKVILIDDGIATGASIHAAIIALKKLSVKKIIIAVPVAPDSTVSELEPLVDEMVCLYPAPIFYGVGQFYRDFSQITDDEVINLLSELRKNR
jgi:predicted phosphoribosyltransferase